MDMHFQACLSPFDSVLLCLTPVSHSCVSLPCLTPLWRSFAIDDHTGDTQAEDDVTSQHYDKVCTNV